MAMARQPAVAPHPAAEQNDLLTVGVEEEFLLVDPETAAAVPAVDEVMEQVPPELRGPVERELQTAADAPAVDLRDRRDGEPRDLLVDVAGALVVRERGVRRRDVELARVGAGGEGARACAADDQDARLEHLRKLCKRASTSDVPRSH